MGKRPLHISKLEKQIINLLWEAAQEQGFSVLGLSNASGITRTRLQGIIDSKNTATFNDVDAMCAVLGLESWEIVREAKLKLSD